MTAWCPWVTVPRHDTSRSRIVLVCGHKSLLVTYPFIWFLGFTRHAKSRFHYAFLCLARHKILYCRVSSGLWARFTRGSACIGSNLSEDVSTEFKSTLRTDYYVTNRSVVGQSKGIWWLLEPRRHYFSDPQWISFLAELMLLTSKSIPATPANTRPLETILHRIRYLSLVKTALLPSFHARLYCAYTYSPNPTGEFDSEQLGLLTDIHMLRKATLRVSIKYALRDKRSSACTRMIAVYPYKGILAPQHTTGRLQYG